MYTNSCVCVDSYLPFSNQLLCIGHFPLVLYVPTTYMYNHQHTINVINCKAGHSKLYVYIHWVSHITTYMYSHR